MAVIVIYPTLVSFDYSFFSFISLLRFPSILFVMRPPSCSFSYDSSFHSSTVRFYFASIHILHCVKIPVLIHPPSLSSYIPYFFVVCLQFSFWSIVLISSINSSTFTFVLRFSLQSIHLRLPLLLFSYSMNHLRVPLVFCFVHSPSYFFYDFLLQLSAFLFFLLPMTSFVIHSSSTSSDHSFSQISICRFVFHRLSFLCIHLLDFTYFLFNPSTSLISSDNYSFHLSNFRFYFAFIRILHRSKVPVSIHRRLPSFRFLAHEASSCSIDFDLLPSTSFLFFLFLRFSIISNDSFRDLFIFCFLRPFGFSRMNLLCLPSILFSKNPTSASFHKFSFQFIHLLVLPLTIPLYIHQSLDYLLHLAAFFNS